MPKILLVGEPIPAALKSALEKAGFPVSTQPLQGGDPQAFEGAELVAVCPAEGQAAHAAALCRRWRIDLGDRHLPILWLAESPAIAMQGLDAGADVCIPPTAPPEYLLAQIRAQLRTQYLHIRLLARSAEASELNQRLQQAYAQIENDLELTRRIHRGFLPKSLPEVNGTRFAVCYRPRSRIGGDFYDAVRLDEDHVGFFVADAMGRGLPASSLLSIFVKRSMVTKEILKNGFRLVPPAEVLNKLNHDLLALSLPEPPFVTMVYAVLNTKDGTLVFARGAHPHPLCVPADGDPEYWHAAGSLLGVFESEYPEQKRTLKPGDKLVLTSDGVHPPRSGGPGSATDRLMESARANRGLPLQAFVDQLARDLLETSRHPEDFTILVLEYK